MATYKPPRGPVFGGKRMDRALRVKQRPEGDVQKSCLDLLRLMHVVHWRTNSRTVLMPGAGGKMRPVFFGKPGGSDIEAIVPYVVIARVRGGEVDEQWSEMRIGRAVYIEVKRPLGPKGGAAGSVQSEAQEQFQALVESAGALYWVVRSAAELAEKLRSVGIGA